MPSTRSISAFALALVAALVATPSQAADAPPGTQRCRLPGLETVAWCGVLQRPLDPARPKDRQIDLHFAVLPSRARNKQPDPVLFFAGGPGQSAIALAGRVDALMARVLNRRDVILVDQRGTGRSAPLTCEDDMPARPLADVGDTERQLAEIRKCRLALQQLPHGDLRQYTTVIAMQDADAVRQALGVGQVNVVGGSYGTRAALDYIRQFPQAVRRAVLDGAAPPDMVLPASFSADSQTAFDAVLSACETAPACQSRYPGLRADWQTLLQSLPREVTAWHPVTGLSETFSMGREAVLSLARSALYAPALASALPLAVTEAARGRFQALLGLGASMGSRPSMALAMGMHFSVVCAEDMPRLVTGANSGDAAVATTAVGADFGDSFSRTYTRVCADWPRGAVPAAFYAMPVAPAATLLLSGGADPATPPRHGERVARALGAKARHVVVPQAGHGVMGIGCMRDVVYRFIDAASDELALKTDADCARNIPRPPAFLPVLPAPAGARP